MKKYILILLLFVSFSVYSQNTINNYKYAVVPERFTFLKEVDQYSLNSLTKALLQNKGFTVYFDNNELPSDIANNKCQALNAELLEKSGMFSTSITLLLKDCKGNVVFKSKEGKSREKDFSTAYNAALRDAFTSLDQIPYTYVEPGNQPVQPIVTPAAAAPIVATTTVAPVVTSTEAVTNQPAGTLYAQATANGYQLIDTTPKVILTLLKTSAADYFIAANTTANGIVLKRDGNWFFEYYKDGKFISEKLVIKF
ncbi:MAG TPA: hypothetical protein VGN20_17700 [Mucilaginibacter sp.]|jgi:hypothetical protein